MFIIPNQASLPPRIGMYPLMTELLTLDLVKNDAKSNFYDFYTECAKINIIDRERYRI